MLSSNQFWHCANSALFFPLETIKILDESHEKTVPPVNEKELQKSGSQTDEKANGNKCVLEDGVQTLGHCINKGDLGYKA